MLDRRVVAALEGIYVQNSGSMSIFHVDEAGSMSILCVDEAGSMFLFFLKDAVNICILHAEDPGNLCILCVEEAAFNCSAFAYYVSKKQHSTALPCASTGARALSFRTHTYTHTDMVNLVVYTL